MVLAAIFCFPCLKVKDTKYIILSERFEFSTHQLCKNKRDQKHSLNFRSKFNVSYFNPGQIRTFLKMSAIFFCLKIYMQCAMYKSKYHSVLRIYTSGFRKHRSNIYMANNYVLLTLWLPGRSARQDPDILVQEFYFSSFEAGIANAISSFKWRKIHKCSIYLTKICVILWLRSLTNDDGNFRHVW